MTLVIVSVSWGEFTRPERVSEIINKSCNYIQ